MPETSWREIVAEKRLRQQATIPKDWVLLNLPPKEQLDVSNVPETCGLLSTKEIEITNSPVEVLLGNMANSVWSSVEVTTAFSKRAIIAHQLTNCLTEIFIERGRKRAEELDEHLKKTGNVVGPLHGKSVCYTNTLLPNNRQYKGLPMSLKDQINIKDIESTMGYVSWIGLYAKKNSVLADILESLGAVLYVKTNIPQTLMWPETFNHVFGRTSNPFNRSLTSGGSSGGEGALIALKGSPLGVGSDIGGSVRIPGAFNGVYGLRPSYGRIPYAGCVNSLEGQDSILSVLGPLSNSIGGIKSFVKGVVSQQPWLKDPLAVRKRWSEEEYQLIEHGSGEQLCFGILWDDEVIKPHPPIFRALQETKKALIEAGHKVIDWKPLKHGEIYTVARDIWGAGATEDYNVTSAPTGEPVIMSMSPEAEKIVANADTPSFRRPPDGISAYELWQVQKKKRDLRQEYVDYWQASVELTGTGRPVDAVISPSAPFVAPPHGLNTYANYTMIWNVLDYPALVIPVSKVDQTLDTKQSAHTFYGTEDQANYDLYEPETFKNAPISIQVVARTLEEEAVIAMSEIVDKALKEREYASRL
ncbi:amidase signature domain-containing protein [Crucibulum laeve]|uniref:amidase n=1 Tax=Crucibulum laeve TaxID=68775 RepID=A0A5C3M087_9AGAR|nr:amidase signature domain-containing protein [Crucibulum laeve]